MEIDEKRDFAKQGALYNSASEYLNKLHMANIGLFSNLQTVCPCRCNITLYIKDKQKNGKFIV